MEEVPCRHVLWTVRYKIHLFLRTATAVAQWLRYCATNRKVAGSIQDGVIGIFHWHNPSDRTMALGMTQPPTEMSPRRIFWGGGECGRCVRLTTLPPSFAVLKKCGNLNFLEPSGPLQACNGTVYLRTTLNGSFRRRVMIKSYLFDSTVSLGDVTFRNTLQFHIISYLFLFLLLCMTFITLS
jgi:hypothetical protein